MSKTEKKKQEEVIYHVPESILNKVVNELGEKLNAPRSIHKLIESAFDILRIPPKTKD